MPEGTKKITREALYDQVWTTPMRRLAKEYGLSDVGLAKVCKKHNIPRPPVGYWAMKQFGKAPALPTLPPMHEAHLQIIEFAEHRIMEAKAPSLPAPRPFFDPQIETLVIEERKRNIVVPDRLHSPHPLVVATKIWHEARSQLEGMSWENPRRRKLQEIERALDIDVSRDAITRGLKIMDTLVKSFEERGYRVQIDKQDYRRKSEVQVLGITFCFRLREQQRRVAHQPTASEKESIKKYGESAYVTKWDLEPTGRFELHVSVKNYYSEHIWKDTKRRLEDQLSEVFIWILTEVDERKEFHARAAREARERAEQERRRQQEEQRRKEEERRVNALLQEVRDWRSSQDLREYVRIFRSLAEQARGPITAESELGHQLTWAEAVADRLDPLTAWRSDVGSTESP